MDIRAPKFLKDGDVLAAVAPSAGASDADGRLRVDTGIKNLENLGFKVVHGDGIYGDDGECGSAPAKNRAEEFMRAYESNCDGIISVAGGELMCEILPFIDFEKISKLPPKWFMGFSDNTNLTFTLTTLCGIQSIYGPCLGQFGPAPLSPDCADAIRMLRGERHFEGYPMWQRDWTENPLAQLNLTEKKVIKPVGYKAHFNGILLGGCLDCLVNLCGTKFDRVREFIHSADAPIVWYLEDCDLNSLSIRRALFELREAGWFETASGFIFGRPLAPYLQDREQDSTMAILPILKDLNLPILIDVDLGHFPPAMPFRNGAKAEVSLVDGNLVVDYLE